MTRRCVFSLVLLTSDRPLAWLFMTLNACIRRSTHYEMTTLQCLVICTLFGRGATRSCLVIIMIKVREPRVNYTCKYVCTRRTDAQTCSQAAFPRNAHLKAGTDRNSRCYSTNGIHVQIRTRRAGHKIQMRFRLDPQNSQFSLYSSKMYV